MALWGIILPKECLWLVTSLIPTPENALWHKQSLKRCVYNWVSELARAQFYTVLYQPFHYIVTKIHPGNHGMENLRISLTRSWHYTQGAIALSCQEIHTPQKACYNGLDGSLSCQWAVCAIVHMPSLTDTISCASTEINSSKETSAISAE